MPIRSAQSVTSLFYIRGREGKVLDCIQVQARPGILQVRQAFSLEGYLDLEKEPQKILCISVASPPRVTPWARPIYGMLSIE